MADSTISGLATAGTLDGTEVLPVVQGGVTNKVSVASLFGYSYPNKFTNLKVVTQASDFDSPANPDVLYLIDGVVDMGSTSILIDTGGINISGLNFNTSKLISSQSSFTLFTSDVDGSGDILLSDLSIEVTGVNSQVFLVTSDNGNQAIEINKLNYNNCTSLGQITNYRQIFESGTGRFGGTPQLTLAGAMNGYRISTSIVRGLSPLPSALFKAGTNLTFSGRFITDINCDLPSSGALLDFSATNITNDESLLIQGAYITRQGAINPSDTSIYPNINHASVKSNWQGNTGLPNTNKYIKIVSIAEVETVITTQDVYYPLLGTASVEKAIHFDSPSNGHIRCLTGIGDYHISGDIIIEGTANDVIDLRVTKSTDGGVTFPEQVNHLRRVINNLSGGRDVAFFQLSFVTSMNKDDRLRLEVENKSSNNNVTAETDGYFIVSEI